VNLRRASPSPGAGKLEIDPTDWSTNGCVNERRMRTDERLVSLTRLTRREMSSLAGYKRHAKRQETLLVASRRRRHP